MRTLPPWRYAASATAARAVVEAALLAFVLVGEARGVSGRRLGLLIACTSAPQLVTAPWLGGVLDRARRPAATLGLLVAGLAAGIALIGGALGRWWFAVVAVLAVSWSIAEPAVMGGLSGVGSRSSAGDGRFETADAVSYGAATILGQAVVAGVALVADAPTVVVVLVVLATGAAIGVARLPLAGVTAGPARPERAWRAGLRRMATDPALRRMTILTTVSISAFGGLGLAAVGVAEHHDRSAAAGAGLVLVMGIAAVAGAAASRLLGATTRPTPAAFVSVAVVGLGFALAAGPWWLAIAGFALAGFADGPLLSATFAVRTARTPSELRASVYTIAASLKIAATAMGAIVVGAVVDGHPRAGVPVLAATQAVALAAGALAGRRPSTT